MKPKRLTPADWQGVYEMERELWGRTFDHLGAPPPASRRTLTFMSPPISYENVETRAIRERQYL